YDEAFSPRDFLHLELRPLSVIQVRQFAAKWLEAKRIRSEEQDRILSTLHECQRDKPLSSLLTTPLQVNIMLLIIKDGGQPPSQREHLFNEYWSTIFRREKSKGKGILQTEEALLFNLHAY